MHEYSVYIVSIVRHCAALCGIVRRLDRCVGWPLRGGGGGTHAVTHGSTRVAARSQLSLLLLLLHHASCGAMAAKHDWPTAQKKLIATLDEAQRRGATESATKPCRQLIVAYREHAAAIGDLLRTRSQRCSLAGDANGCMVAFLVAHDVLRADGKASRPRFIPAWCAPAAMLRTGCC